MSNVNLSGMSAVQLDTLAAKAKSLAADLRKSQPTYDLALAAGVRDNSYGTVRWGRVASYSGEAVVTLEDGSRWRCVGRRPKGDAETVERQGYIEFIPLPPEESPAMTSAELMAEGLL